MAEPLEVAWSELSTSSKGAFGWAEAAATVAQKTKEPRVGSGALLFGVMQAHPKDSEPLQLLERYGLDRSRLIAAAQRISAGRAPFTDAVRAAHTLDQFPPHSQGVRNALAEARRLAGKSRREGSVSLAHLFGGLLMTDASASKALADVLRGHVTLAELRRAYPDYLREGGRATYRRFLESAAVETPAPTVPAQQFVSVHGAGLDGTGFVLKRASFDDVVTATLVTGAAGDENPITVRFASTSDQLPAEVVAQTPTLTLLRPPQLRPRPAGATLSTPQPGMQVSCTGVDGSEVQSTIAQVESERVEITDAVSLVPGAPVFETATGAVVGIADSPTSIINAAVLSRPPFGPTVALGTLGGAGNDSVAETDQLNFNSYVDAFASLIASPHTTPPLTIGIFGSWGMGKSFLLEHIDREIRSRQEETPDAIPRVHIVRFNAWEYSATEVVWPALVRKIVEKLDKDVPWPWWRKAWTRVKWNLPRTLRQERTAVVTLAVVAAVAFGAALWRGRADLVYGIAAVAGVLGVSGLAKAASNPVARWVTTLFTASDYGGQIAHMDEIKNDLETLEKRLHEKGDPTKSVIGRILILIDDLDRCEPEKAVEMLQAVNLLLNFKSFVVCLGIDARIVTGAIEKHYEGLLGRTGASGYEYLDKIVQIPFRIPEPNPDEVKAFIKSQLGDPQPPPAPDAPQAVNQTAPEAEEPRPADGALNADMPDAGEPTEDQPQPAEEAEHDAVPFSHAELEAFEAFAALLRPNPRHLKRMVNVYRLVRTLARANADEALLQNPAAMIRWLVMWGQWPYTSLKILERFDEILDETAEDAVPEDLGDGDPLVYLLAAVETELDAPTRDRLDDQADDLRALLNAEGATFSWTELQRIRKYTVNFNPAVEERLRAADVEP